MKKSRQSHSRQLTDMEPDFAHSRAGLGTHKKNCAEQQRLQDKLRSLETLQRRSMQQRMNEERDILQGLTTSHGARALTTPSRPSDLDPLSPYEYRSSSRLSRRGSLQPETLAYLGVKDAGSECTTPLVLNPGARGRRPSVILQELASHPVIDVSTEPRDVSRHVDSDTIIDMIAARNRPRGEGAERAATGPRRGSDHSDTGSSDHHDLQDSPKDADLKPLRRARRGSLGGPSLLPGDADNLPNKLGPVRPEGPGPARGRRASLDVGIANLSLLSPASALSGVTAGHHVSSRRSSLASSQVCVSIIIISP